MRTERNCNWSTKQLKRACNWARIKSWRLFRNLKALKLVSRIKSENWLLKSKNINKKDKQLKRNSRKLERDTRNLVTNTCRPRLIPRRILRYRLSRMNSSRRKCKNSRSSSIPRLRDSKNAWSHKRLNGLRRLQRRFNPCKMKRLFWKPD